MVPMLTNHRPTDRGTMSLRKVSAYACCTVGVIILVCVVVFLIFPDTFINGYPKSQAIRAFTSAYPGYSIRIARVHYNLWKNRVGCDGLSLRSVDSAFSCSIAKVSVSGIGWLQVLWHEDKALRSCIADARDIMLTFRKSQYTLRCKRLRASVTGSEIVAEALELHPLVGDDTFFASRKFRRTRFQIVLPECSVTGADCLGLLQGKTYCARSVKVNDASLDILANMDTPYNKNASQPRMPNEALSSIHKITQVDSVNIINGRLKYAERYVIGSPPAEVTFDAMRLSVVGITNRAVPGATAAIHGQGKFMKTSTMKIHMAVPVVSPEIPLRCSGSLDGMDLTRLNSFLETGENVRIKSGTLQSATIDITIRAGRASGSVRAMYEDLNIAALNKRTGSEKGAINRISSFVVNATKIRRTNMPDKSGSIRIGDVKYEQRRDDTFLQLVWFSLRSGIGDVVGF